jgi:hypothetical protein
MAKTRSVGHLLNNANAGLAKVIQRSKELKKLTNTLKNLVDSPLSEHIYVANIRDKTLVIGTDSAVWHTRIKYLAPVILEQIRQVPGLERLQQVEFKIQHLAGGNYKEQSSTFIQRSDSEVEQSAQPQDDSLQLVLQRIAKKKDQNPR